MESLPGHIESKSAENQRYVSTNGTNRGTPFSKMAVKYTIPKLSKGKEWFVFFRIWDHDSQKMVLKKYRADLNRLSGRERQSAGKQLLEYLTEELKYGWIPDGITVAEKKDDRNLIESLEWILELKKPSLRHRSYQSYRYVLNLFSEFITKTGKQWYYPEHFRKANAIEFADWMVARGLSGKTFNGYRGFLFTLFRALVDREIIQTNPISAIKNQVEQAGTHLAYTEQEWERILICLDTSKRPQLGVFVRFIYFTYIRPIELLRLKVRNFDLDAGTITIYGSQSKNKKQESVVIPDAFIDMVKCMHLEKLEPDDFVFGYGLRPGKRSCSRNSVTRWFREALNELGGFTENHTMYSCKHTGVSAAVKAGLNIYDISRQCRHKSILETQNYFRSLGLVPNEGFRVGMR